MLLATVNSLYEARLLAIQSLIGSMPSNVNPLPPVSPIPAEFRQRVDQLLPSVLPDGSEVNMQCALE